MVSDLTPATQDYVKTIWTAQEWAAKPVTTSALAQRMGLSPSTVSDAVKKLAAQGLVAHAPYGSIELTDRGRKAAISVVRRHRLIESFLVDYLGYAWDEVHSEAETLEHAASDRMIDRLENRLGNPSRDPHGDPIPTREGTLPELLATQLSTITQPKMLTVARVSDADPNILRYLADAGIGLGMKLSLVSRKDFAGTLTVDINGRTLDLGIPVAEAVWVSTD